jgi:hypothetical protein
MRRNESDTFRSVKRVLADVTHDDAAVLVRMEAP